jgi:predicted RNase H-like HicB family nuclease
MTFPIVVEPCDGQFAASLLGEPKVRVVGRTRSQALDALKTEIEHRVAIGELLSLEIGAIGVANLAGKYETDPTLRTICSEAYEKRDSDRS